MRELQVWDEDEREAGKIEDWGVSERCNYSSQQGEGEITTHSMLRPILATPPVWAWTCMYVFRLCASSTCFHVCFINTRTGRKPVEGKWASKKKKKRVHISIITAGCTHGDAHACRPPLRRSKPALPHGWFYECYGVVFPGEFRVWMKISFPALSLSSSAEPKAGRGSWI